MAAKFLWSPASLHPMAVMLSMVTFVLSIAISVLCCENFMPAKRGPKKRPAATPDANLNTLREIVSNGTKTGIAQTLVKLQSAGLLNADIAQSNLRNVRQKLQDAEKNHGEQRTPYGPLIQEMSLPIKNFKPWKFVHPLALLYYMSMLSDAFGACMHAVCEDGTPLQLILYMDEICPGNPLRPEKSRTMQAIYWVFSDFPQWILSRTLSWPVFGVIRSNIIQRLPGGMSHFMRYVLLQFFPERGHSLARGVQIKVRQTMYIVRSVFQGFLADDKAHTEVNCCKGATGTC